ncbi:hypothetical protein M8998_05065 [Sphingobacterium sp. lm-10]|uniref:hypothetical protein n=1 Tax=Sphingobacterium sp. lm-10 TaxID=2944904 RepID=UPI00201FFA1D|nr:hypothetical protein [Sphingobacterium sp. lm-10]MCL7987309.1 hypothetical protein [Sphingobacterium sp. lm-10]
MIASLKRLLIVFSFSILLTGCFDIVEDVALQSNGSGTIKATVNLSKSKTKVASLMKLDKVDGMKIPKPADIRKEMAEIVAILQKTPGISQVQHSLDFTNFIGSLSCKFTSVEALNAFTTTLSNHLKTNINGYSNYGYQSKTGIFERKSNYNTEAKKKLESLSPESKKSFHDAYYSAIYRFDRPIVSVSNPAAQVSANKKAIMMKVPALQVLEGKINLSNKIQLSN